MRQRVSRRSFLGKAALGAGGLLVLTAGGLTWRAWERGALGNLYEGPAFEPWKDWNNHRRRGALGMISAAILASNPHNSQPWLFRYSGRPRHSQIEFYADMKRGLRSIDPYLREMHIGLGCALENLIIAAGGAGLIPRLTMFPDVGNASLIARIDLTPGVSVADAHLRAIGDRRTNRSSYDRAQDLPPAVLDAFQRQVKHPATCLKMFPAESTEGVLFAEGTIDATAKFIADEEMVRDSHRWFRATLQEMNDKRDGPALIEMGMPEWKTRVALALPDSWLGDWGKNWLQMTEHQHCRTTPRFGIIAVNDRQDRAQLLEAGRLWQRLHLEATLQGIAMHPLNQMMEIYDRDCSNNYISIAGARLDRMMGDGDWRPVFGFRCGFASQPATPSARRGVSEILVEE